MIMVRALIMWYSYSWMAPYRSPRLVRTLLVVTLCVLPPVIILLMALALWAPPVRLLAWLRRTVRLWLLVIALMTWVVMGLWSLMTRVIVP